MGLDDERGWLHTNSLSCLTQTTEDAKIKGATTTKLELRKELKTLKRGRTQCQTRENKTTNYRPKMIRKQNSIGKNPEEKKISKKKTFFKQNI